MVRRKHTTECEKTNLLKKKYNQILDYFNDRKIKSKMMYLYLFCVMVPVFITNVVIISSILNLSNKERKESLDNMASVVSNSIETTISNAVYETVDLYSNRYISSFLDTHYESAEQYYIAYRNLFNNYLFYASSKNLISSVVLYSNNDTMINGGRYYRLENEMDSEWYQSYQEHGSNLFVHSYFNDVLYESQRRRILCVIRKLDYAGAKNIEKLVKIEMNYDQINNIVKETSPDGKIYVCYEDHIIFSNDEKVNLMREDYVGVDYIVQDQVQTAKDIMIYGGKWSIYITGYKTSYLSVIQKNMWLIIVLFLVDGLLPIFVLNVFSKSITQRVLLLGKYMNQVKMDSFEQIEQYDGKDEISELFDNYNRMVNRIKELIESEYKSKLNQQELYLARQQAELHALYSQINPHFMFNVLECIRMRCLLKHEDETSKMVESLASLMRRNASWKEDFIPLRQEIEFTEDYLKLQKYRFGEGFRYKFHIQEECYEKRIPSLSLVTFVENACVHGLNRQGHDGSIYINAYLENQKLILEIDDTGIGMEEEKTSYLEDLLNHATIEDLQKTESLGIINTMIRLKKYCSEQTNIQIASELGAGTCITITIPY